MQINIATSQRKTIVQDNDDNLCEGRRDVMGNEPEREEGE